jgi:hypothetical protein
MSLNVLTRIGPVVTFVGTSTLRCVVVSGIPVRAAVSVYGSNRTSPPTAALAVEPELFRRFAP